MEPLAGSSPPRLRTPALLLDLEVLEANLARMASRAEALGVALRPHVKTHKCVEIAERQRALGARGITVSTLAEARCFARAGFSDITWAFPLILDRLDEVAELAGEARLGVTVDGPEAVEALESLGRPLRVWLKVDCGYGRAGVDPRSEASLRLARRVAESSTIDLVGVLSHSGQAYGASSPEELAAIAERERSLMVEFAIHLRAAGVACPEVSVGSTPAMSRAGSLDGVSEARPGNYALYDYTQVRLGSCKVRDCAATVLASVVSCQPGADHSVIDAGALALSKDLGPDREPIHYGRLLAESAEPRLHPEALVTSVSQEHGILNRPLPVGSRVRILPNHACLTVALFDAFDVVRGGQPVARWRIRRER